MLPSWPHFPGAGHVVYRQYDGDPAGPALWARLEAAVTQRKISAALQTAGVDLLMADGAVTGAAVVHAGRRKEIHARGGVVPACGGFEYDAELRDTYLPLPLGPVGHPGNTGDTIRLATGAGASLWHMSAFFGGWPLWRLAIRPAFRSTFTRRASCASTATAVGSPTRPAGISG